MSKKIIFNDWTLFSEDFELELFVNGNKVIVKECSLNREQLFEGEINSNSLHIYDMASYESSMKIDYSDRTINFIKKHYDDED